MQNQQPVGFGAKCAVHPDRTASRTCARCGNFTCDECNSSGLETMCPACRALVGTNAFPYTRAAFSFDEIWNFTFERWKQEWVMLSICILILLAVGFAVGIFSSVFQGIARAIIGNRGGSVGVAVIAAASSIMSQLVATLVQGVFQMGIYRVYIDVLNGRKADVGRMMTQFSKLGRYILQMLIIFLIIVVPVLLYIGAVAVASAVASGVSLSNLDHIDRDFRPIGGVIFALGMLALIPVLIYVALPLQFATMELVYSDSQPLDSIRRAYQLAADNRLSIVGYGFVAGLVVLVGVLACCVGMIPALALGQMLTVGLYLALRNGSGLPPAADA